MIRNADCLFAALVLGLLAGACSTPLVSNESALEPAFCSAPMGAKDYVVPGNVRVVSEVVIEQDFLRIANSLSGPRRPMTSFPGRQESLGQRI